MQLNTKVYFIEIKTILSVGIRIIFVIFMSCINSDKNIERDKLLNMFLSWPTIPGTMMFMLKRELKTVYYPYRQTRRGKDVIP